MNHETPLVVQVESSHSNLTTANLLKWLEVIDRQVERKILGHFVPLGLIKRAVKDGIWPVNRLRDTNTNYIYQLA